MLWLLALLMSSPSSGLEEANYHASGTDGDGQESGGEEEGDDGAVAYVSEGEGEDGSENGGEEEEAEMLPGAADRYGWKPPPGKPNAAEPDRSKLSMALQTKMGGWSFQAR